jgi:undecaprenyl-diphosphatase
MSLFQALILGIVQGITEFLPVSSTAHLRVVPALLGWPDPGAAYSAVIQLGTVAAVMIYFARDLWRIAAAVLSSVKAGDPLGTHDARLGFFVAAGTVPIVVAGLAFKRAIEHELRSLSIIAFSAIALAVVLLLAERAARHVREIEHLTFKDSLLIGLAQCVALVPGSSRSGVTLTAGLFLGLKRDAAARFSFLLSIPATAAAGIFELQHLLAASRAGHGVGVAATVVGVLSSFIFGYAAIAALLRFLRTRTTLVFVVYRLVLGASLFGLLAQGVLPP